jgi:hypothetical protein
MKRFSLLYMGALAGVLACFAPRASIAGQNDQKTVITISQPTEVPGIVLAPGTYVIRRLDSPSTQHIIEIMNERMDHLYALTFTASAERVQRTGKTVLTFYEGRNGNPPALRTWFWPGETIGEEFLYPKDQAAKISAATSEKVPVGEIPKVADLTPDNQKNVVSSNSGNQSQSTPSPVVAQAAAPEPTSPPPPAVIAQNAPPPAQPQPEVTPQSNPAVASSNTPTETAANDNSAQTLPQTASPLYLIGAVGLVSLALALLLGFVKRQTSV